MRFPLGSIFGARSRRLRIGAAALTLALGAGLAAPAFAQETAADETAPAAPQAATPAAEALPEDDFWREFDIGFDALVLRPMGALQLGIGSAMLLAAYPLSYPGGGQQEVLDVLFWSPYDYTIRRPLGEF